MAVVFLTTKPRDEFSRAERRAIWVRAHEAVAASANRRNAAAWQWALALKRAAR